MTPINLNPGPSPLPTHVLKLASDSVLDYSGTGLSILSISHRSNHFERIVNDANAAVLTLMGLSPSEFSVLWMQGGASLQFHALAANLAARYSGVAEYLVSGTWSDKAHKAARHAGLTTSTIRTQNEPWTRAANRQYTWVCTNETVDGIELDAHTLDRVCDWSDCADRPLVVADMSSNLFSKQLDFNKFDVMVAGAQKNIGCAGVTLVVCRTALFNQPANAVPTMLDYHTYINSNSLYNTPPVYAIYVAGLVLNWLITNGGLPWIHDLNTSKADALYSALTNSIYFVPIVDNPSFQSRMNVVFGLHNGKNRVPEWENRFLLYAEQEFAIVGLRGHRSVGGCRASLYNAVTLDNVNVLVACILKFDALLHEEVMKGA